MTPLKLCLVGFIVCSLTVGCSVNNTEKNRSDDESFRQENTIEGYKLLVDIGETRNPYDLAFSSSGWQICAYHPSSHPETLTDSARDTIVFRSMDPSAIYVFSSFPVGKSESIYNIQENNGYVFLNARSGSTGEKNIIEYV